MHIKKVHAIEAFYTHYVQVKNMVMYKKVILIMLYLTVSDCI